jgi:dihydrofolate reductase
MRKIINSTYITLDGAIEDPHLWPSLGSVAEVASYAIQNDLLHACDALIMGRRTYNTFAAVWPTRAGDSFSDRINAMRKFVVSTTMGNPTWQNTTVIRENLIEALRTMKQQPGRDILQYGLGRVSFAMLEHRLIDEVRLWIHPLILGRRGPSLPHFVGCPPVRLHLCETRVLANGISVMSYRVDYVSVEAPRRGSHQRAAERVSMGGVG